MIANSQDLGFEEADETDISALMDDIQETNDRINKSGVREIFTPHIPISRLDCLKGRNKELTSLFEHLTTPGQHALLFGERGVGKSSLATTAANEIATRYQLTLFIKRCSKEDSFASIFEKPLKQIGIDVYNISERKTKGIQAKLSNLSVIKNEEYELEGEYKKSLNPSFIADKLFDTKALFVIDEFDAIRNEEDKHRIAEVLKLLSDRNSAFRILIVGIADSSKELTRGHPSVSRCLREIKLRKIQVKSLVDIIRNGAKKINIEFNPIVIAKIAIVSSGYPYFTHLLALKASEIVIADERNIVTIKDLEYATKQAIDNSEESLSLSYYESVNYKNREMYERILLAAATCREEHFKTSDIVRKYYDLYKESITTKQISSYLKNLVNDDTSKIIRRLYKGAYRFSDPRMPSYVKIQRAHLPDQEDA